MDSISIDVLLDRVAEQYSDSAREDESATDQILATAEDIIFGTDENPELSSDGESVSVDDYSEFGDLICNGAVALPTEDEDLYDDVLTQLDDILIDELDLESRTISLWGECPTEINSLQSASSDAVETGISGSSSRVSQGQHYLAASGLLGTPGSSNKPKAKSSKTSSPYHTYILGGSREPQKVGPALIRVYSPHAIKSRGEQYETCMGLGIEKGGAYLIYVEQGFACEYNYDSGSEGRVLYINEKGEKAEINVLRFFPRELAADSIPTAIKVPAELSPVTVPAATLSGTANPETISPFLKSLDGKVVNLSEQDKQRALKKEKLTLEDMQWRLEHGLNPLPYTGPPVDEATGEVIESSGVVQSSAASPK